MGLPRPLSVLSRKREVVRQFTPSWFIIVMGTGIVSSLIASFPYPAPAKLQVGWAFWWLALVQFVAFTLLLAARFAFFWRGALRLFTHNTQALFLGAIPPALGTIVNGFPLFLAHYWDAPTVMEAAVVLWWLQASLAMACTLLLPFYIFTHHITSLEHLTALSLLPILPCVVAAGSGGIVAQSAAIGSALPIVYMCFILWGIGVPLCFMVMVIYYRRLIMHSLPPKELIVSSFLPVGPIGMGALALLNLGAALLRLFPPPDLNTMAALSAAAAGAVAPGSPPAALVPVLELIVQGNIAVVVDTVGTVVALILWGMGTWWLALAIISVCSCLNSLPFSIGSWGFVFPVGVFASAANELWPRLPGFGAMRVMAAILSCCTILLWAVLAAYTLFKGWNGALFVAPCLASIAGSDNQSGEKLPDVGPGDDLCRKTTTTATECGGSQAEAPALGQRSSRGGAGDGG